MMTTEQLAPDTTGKYLDLDQAAAALGVEPFELYVTIREGHLGATWAPALKTYYLLKTDVDAYRATHP